MLLSIQNSHLATIFGIEESIRILKETGFDAYDMSLFDMAYSDEYIFNTDEYKQYAKKLRRCADSLGIVCNQAHAPFPSSFGNREKDEDMYFKIVRSMEIASILGAKIIVVHPKQHLRFATKGNPQLLEEINIDFYRSLIPYCKKFNVKVAAENMFQWDGAEDRALDSTCSAGDEFVRYIDRIDSDEIVACLDIGHVQILNRDIPEMIKALGHDRLKALHIHDNDGRHDLHTLPYTVHFGHFIDFEAFAKALADIDYDGDFTFEADNFLSRFPNELKGDATRLTAETGRLLMKMIEAKKGQCVTGIIS
ncbi:MAG: sugar phosphate isomerase/epimerase [Clostridia bacterium]|nr:sugar phosphate isomerase/epimerase [Clostridia bacterium]